MEFLKDLLKKAKAAVMVMLLSGLSVVQANPLPSSTIEPWHFPCGGGSTATVIDRTPPPPREYTPNEIEDLYRDVVVMSTELSSNLDELKQKYIDILGARTTSELEKEIHTHTGLISLQQITPEYLASLKGQEASHIQDVFERHAHVAVFIEQAIRDELGHQSGIFREDLKKIEKNHLYPMLCKFKEIMFALKTELQKRVRRSVMGQELRELEGIQQNRYRDYVVLHYLKQLTKQVTIQEFEEFINNMSSDS